MKTKSAQFVSKRRFPIKLFEAVNDGKLIKWNIAGTGIWVEERLYEASVLKWYPTFVQINSFANFRRLLREYNFRWSIVKNTENIYQFSHPYFRFNRRDLLCYVMSRRKSSKSAYLLSEFGKPKYKQHHKMRCKYKRTRHMSRLLKVKYPSVTNQKNTDFVKSKNIMNDSIIDQLDGKDDKSNSVTEPTTCDSATFNSCYENVHKNLIKRDLQNIIMRYAMNEMTDNEWMEYITTSNPTFFSLL